MSVALLSHAKQSDCRTAQPNSCIADDHVLNERYTGTTATAETHRTYKICYKQTERLSCSEPKNKASFVHWLKIKNDL